MLILPEKDQPSGRFLLPIRRTGWRQSSQRRSIFGIESVTRFRLTAHLSDGFIIWRSWFDDRDDADAFLYALAAGSLLYERELWDLPTPAWRPGIGESVWYDFFTTRFITTTSAANQTDAVPADWNTVGINSIEVIASGGGGARSNGNVALAAYGAGGGAYSKINNIALTPNGSITFHLEAGGLGATAENTSGVTGGDAWYNGATLAASSVGAKGGVGGQTGGTGGQGGAAASGIVTGTGGIKYSGGSTTSNVNAAGGGAGGPNGNGGGGAAGAVGGGGGGGGGSGGGSNGSAAASTTGGNGGNNFAGSGAGAGNASGDGGSGTAGGGGGGGGNNNTSAKGGTGGTGTEWDASHGAGGGGGGGSTNVGVTAGFAGGNGGTYGGGGAGGGHSTVNGTSGNGGNGGQAIIVQSYSPVVAFPIHIVSPMKGVISITGY